MVLLAMYGLTLTLVALYTFVKNTKQSLPQAFWIITLIGGGLATILVFIKMISFGYFIGAVLLPVVSVYLARLLRKLGGFNINLKSIRTHKVLRVGSSPMRQSTVAASKNQVPSPQSSQVISLRKEVRQLFQRCQALQEKYQTLPPATGIVGHSLDLDLIIQTQQSVDHLKTLHTESTVYRQQTNQHQQTITHLQKFSITQVLKLTDIKQTLKASTKLLVQFEQNLLDTIVKVEEKVIHIIKEHLWDTYQQKAAVFSTQQAQLVNLKYRYQNAKKMLQEELENPLQKLNSLVKWPLALTSWLLGDKYTVKDTTRKLQLQVDQLWQEVTQKIQELEGINDQIARVRHFYQNAKQANRDVVSIWAVYDTMNAKQFWGEYEQYLDTVKQQQQSATIQKAS